MRIVGEWIVCDDGVTRPFVAGRVHARDGSVETDAFLIDTGADRTVFSENLFVRLGLPPTPESGDSILQGVSGACESITVTTIVELTRDDKGPVHMRGRFAAFTESTSSHWSILGRDNLNHFDLILSRRRNEVILLPANCEYRVHVV